MRLKFRVEEKGGAGSGNFGHAGRPGKRGGSAPSGAGGGKDYTDSGVRRYGHNTPSGHPPAKYGRTSYSEVWVTHIWSGGATNSAVKGVRRDNGKIKRIKTFGDWDEAQRFVDSIIDTEAPEYKA